MPLYYQDDYVTLYHGNCLTEHREWLAADVLVTDPPYGVGYTSGAVKGRSRSVTAVRNDKSPAARDAALLAWGGGPSLVFGRWDIERPSNTRARLIWDKGNTVGMGNLSFPWGQSEEEIYVSGDGFAGKRAGNVIRVQMLMSGAAERPEHPTPKPVGLMELLIAKCPPGVIADPFAGSGSTLIAAKNRGRRVVGVELEEKYCEIIAKRCSQELLDLEWIA